MEIDAFDLALGAIILQMEKDEKLYSSALYSKTFLAIQIINKT